MASHFSYYVNGGVKFPNNHLRAHVWGLWQC